MVGVVELKPGRIRRPYKTSRKRRQSAMERRDRLRDLGLCINGEAHGPATHGCRCQSCDKTHKESA